MSAAVAQKPIDLLAREQTDILGEKSEQQAAQEHRYFLAGVPA